MAKFESHGRCSAQWQGNILLLYFDETFNLEGIDDVSEFIEELVEESAPAKWARVEIHHDDSILVPIEGILRVQQDLYHSQQHGCRLFCTVNGNLLANELAEQITQAIGMANWHGDSVSAAVHYAEQFLQAE